jgi:hypothetical protein
MQNFFIRGDNSSPMRPFFICSIALLLLLTGAQAFPLTGQSDQANITVFGIIQKDQDSQTMNILVDTAKAQGSCLASASLVDTEDKFYNAYDGNFDSGYYADRFYMSFRVPKGTEIKRLRLVPMTPGHNQGTPFSIDWEAVPEASDETLSMKMYSVKSGDYYMDDLKTWAFDVKLTNNGTDTIPFSVKDFGLVDQFGWRYNGKDYVDNSSGHGQLTSGESMRFDLTFSRISELSRPVKLVYGNLSMDISAWT